jgi:CelD/BcsL family acetyltransferase involved in cellulose biosynthesis
VLGSVEVVRAQHYLPIQLDFPSRWEALFDSVPTASPFLSPLWVSEWLRVYAASLYPQEFVFPVTSTPPKAMALLVPSVKRRGLIRFRRLHLNTDGEADEDTVYVENNSLLCEPSNRSASYAAMAEVVRGMNVHEFHAAGIGEEELRELLEAFPDWHADLDGRSSPYVDLEKVRASGGELAACLRPNSRSQLRRSIKKYEARAPLTYECAKTGADALAFLEELAALHAARWRERGQGGAFLSKSRNSFHSGFVQRAVPKGQASLIRVRSGETTIGVIYSLIAHGRVNFYQSGFQLTEDPHLKPGWVSHSLAVRHFAEMGLSEYDFLASAPGESKYKQSLSTDQRTLYWLCLARPCIPNTLLRFARRLRK